MLKNTSYISFGLYGFFIAITLILTLVAISQIKKGKIESDKLTKIIELFKYSIVTVAIATTTLIISDLFKEREQDISELEYFDKYVDDVKNANGIYERYQLSKYLSIVAPEGPLKESWKDYHDTVIIEYKKHLIIVRKKDSLDSIPNPTKTQQNEIERLNKKIKNNNSPIISYKKTNSKDHTLANHFEILGFKYLLEKDIENSIKSFVKCENAYNSYHQAYEISKYLKKHHKTLTDKNSDLWVTVNRTIANDYSYGMSPETKEKLLNFD